ncbi:ABC-type cobalamin/Fe3+-siderophores transport systems, ATPase component [Thermoplasmatales archaeon BRNA1]|nr:ABC-type cobalamin/Fe3+-siderophores transport systems, ATPase component [Thermoplasmatales archaeon BRNA1]
MVFGYAKKNNLEDITFDISPGEFVAVMGQNGSGKTTLMRCINKILKIRSGEILVDDNSVKTMTMEEIARLCTTVPADTSLDFSLTVRDFVSLGRSPFLKSVWWEDAEDERIIDQALWDFGITQYAGRRLHELSSGERARVLLAKGVVQTPKLMLVDEPSAHLDIKYKVQVMELLRMLADKGMAILMANHDINLLTRFCDRILLLHEGHIIGDGTPREVINEENIRKVFGIEVDMVEAQGVPYVLPTGSTEWSSDSKQSAE